MRQVVVPSVLPIIFMIVFIIYVLTVKKQDSSSEVTAEHGAVNARDATQSTGLGTEHNSNAARAGAEPAVGP
ncbi:hypothetical protein V5799_024547 [Amblyomma americanum]|uniref:Uncharacterized protein n=1 Tax=Amblyomma americanum TaxID=6943 RepID=A0AAQ4EBR3_AMBAM